MTVTHVKSTEEYKKLIANDSKLVVVDFFATWYSHSSVFELTPRFRCGPCKRISPYIEQLAKELENVVFLKVDVDELEVSALSNDYAHFFHTFQFVNELSLLGQ